MKKQVDLAIVLLLQPFVAFAMYLAFVLIFDLRLDTRIPAIHEGAIQIAVKEAVKAYEAKQLEDEPLRVKKRKERDALVKRYLKSLEEVME